MEAIVEERADKVALIERLAPHLGEDTILSSTTSSLSIEDLAAAAGRPERFTGLHVFNPVTKMDLIELVFPDAASQATRERSFALCEQLGKTAVEVPDLPGFVVNRLLFPFLFEAVRLREQTGLEPAAVDSCLQLGAGHPDWARSPCWISSDSTSPSRSATRSAPTSPNASTRSSPRARWAARAGAASTPTTRNVAQGERRRRSSLAWQAKP